MKRKVDLVKADFAEIEKRALVCTKLWTEIGSRLYAPMPKRSDEDCPFCGRLAVVDDGVTDPRSSEFRYKSHHRHVLVCYEKKLAKMGYLRGNYIAKHRLHVLIRIKVPEIVFKKGWPSKANWTYMDEVSGKRCFSGGHTPPPVSDFERQSLRRIKRLHK